MRDHYAVIDRRYKPLSYTHCGISFWVFGHSSTMTVDLLFIVYLWAYRTHSARLWETTNSLTRIKLMYLSFYASTTLSLYKGFRCKNWYFYHKSKWSENFDLFVLQTHLCMWQFPLLLNVGLIGLILDDRLKEKFLKSWKGVLCIHFLVHLSICLSVR